MTAHTQSTPTQTSIPLYPKPPVLHYYSRKRLNRPPRTIPQPPARRHGNCVPVPANRSRRDIVNLSECHACGSRVDICKGKRRLQALYSEWRIVLLCRKCLVGVESSVICSYCFEECCGDEGGGSFRCGGCKRRVHRECFSRYGSVAPWSYSGAGRCEEFRVCIDCWVPKTVARLGMGGKRRRKKGKGDGDVECGVLESGCVEKNGVLMKRMGGGDVEVKKMVVREDAVERSLVVLAMQAGDEIKKGSNSFDRFRGMCGDNINEFIGVNGSALDFHRSNNADRLLIALVSADKVTNDVCELNTELHVRDVESSVEEKVSNQCSMDDSAMGTSAEPDTSQRIDECMTKFDGGREYLDVRLPQEGEGSCSNGMGSECRCCWKRDESVNRRGDQRSYVKRDRFALKYQKRSLLSMHSLNKKSVLVYKRKLQIASAPLLPNCSSESRTCGGTLQSFAAPMQPFASTSGSHKKPQIVYKRKLQGVSSIILTNQSNESKTRSGNLLRSGTAVLLPSTTSCLSMDQFQRDHT